VFHPSFFPLFGVLKSGRLFLVPPPGPSSFSPFRPAKFRKIFSPSTVNFSRFFFTLPTCTLAGTYRSATQRCIFPAWNFARPQAGFLIVSRVIFFQLLMGMGQVGTLRTPQRLYLPPRQFAVQIDHVRDLIDDRSRNRRFLRTLRSLVAGIPEAQINLEPAPLH